MHSDTSSVSRVLHFCLLHPISMIIPHVLYLSCLGQIYFYRAHGLSHGYIKCYSLVIMFVLYKSTRIDEANLQGCRVKVFPFLTFKYISAWSYNVRVISQCHISYTVLVACMYKALNSQLDKDHIVPTI